MLPLHTLWLFFFSVCNALFAMQVQQIFIFCHFQFSILLYCHRESRTYWMCFLEWAYVLLFDWLLFAVYWFQCSLFLNMLYWLPNHRNLKFIYLYGYVVDSGGVVVLSVGHQTCDYRSQVTYTYTVSGKKSATLFFAITLSNPNGSSKFFYHHTQQ